MSTKSRLKDVVGALEASIANTRCSDLAQFLESLGFEIRNGKSPGHKIVTHAGLQSFHATSYNCGHGKNPVVQRVYVRKIVRLLNQYEKELIAAMGERSEDNE